MSPSGIKKIKRLMIGSAWPACTSSHEASAVEPNPINNIALPTKAVTKTPGPTGSLRETTKRYVSRKPTHTVASVAPTAIVTALIADQYSGSPMTLLSNTVSTGMPIAPASKVPRIA